MTKGTRRGWFGREREAGEPADHAEEAKLWTAHLQAREAANHIVESAAQLLASTARQQALLDGVTDLGRQAASRGPEIQEPMDHIVQSLDRLRLVALNVGLEGARLGDPAGRALMNVADEVRGLTERADEAMQELRGSFDDTLSTWNHAVRRTDELRDAHAAIVVQASRQQTVAQDIVRHVDAIGEHARSLLETDPQTAVVLAQVVEHAKGLVQALGSLGGRARREVVRSALGPLLQPLLRTLLDVARTSKGKPGSE